MDALLHFMPGELGKESVGVGRYRAGRQGFIPEKVKRLQLWLCSSCPLLRGSKTTWMHVPLQPLMRSPLSRSQTPTAPRRAVGFFRSGRAPSCLDSLITQPTSDWPSFNLGQPFQPSTEVKVNLRLKNVNAAIRCSMWKSRSKTASAQILYADSIKDELLHWAWFCTCDAQRLREIPSNSSFAESSKFLDGALILQHLDNNRCQI